MKQVHIRREDFGQRLRVATTSESQDKKMITRAGITAALLTVSIVMTLVALSGCATDAKPDAKAEAPKKTHFDPVIKNIEGGPYEEG